MSEAKKRARYALESLHLALKTLQSLLDYHDAVVWWKPKTWGSKPPQTSICSEVDAFHYSTRRDNGAFYYTFELKEQLYAAIAKCKQTDSDMFPVANDTTSYDCYKNLWSIRSEAGQNRRKLLRDMINYCEEQLRVGV